MNERWTITCFEEAPPDHRRLTWVITSTLQTLRQQHYGPDLLEGIADAMLTHLFGQVVKDKASGLNQPRYVATHAVNRVIYHDKGAYEAVADLPADFNEPGTFARFYNRDLHAARSSEALAEDAHQAAVGLGFYCGCRRDGSQLCGLWPECEGGRNGVQEV